MRAIADTADFIAVYPQALPDPNDGNSTNWVHKDPTDVDDIYFVEAMIDTTASEYMIDEDRVYACGYSLGGEFSFELTCRLNDRIAAMASIARSMGIYTLENSSPTHPTAVLTIHGTEDYYNGLEWGGVLYYVSLDSVNSYWAKYNNTNTTPTVTQIPDINSGDGSTVEYHSYDDGDSGVSVGHFKVISGGHDWPGSFGNMDIDATVEIWNFVSKYDINGLIGTSAIINQKSGATNDIVVSLKRIAGSLILETDFLGNHDYEIFSLSGKKVLAGVINSNKQRINVSNLSPNIYFLRTGNQIMKINLVMAPGK
jgi:polyhydroxybutyrate depolymerase